MSSVSYRAHFFMFKTLCFMLKKNTFVIAVINAALQFINERINRRIPVRVYPKAHSALSI